MIAQADIQGHWVRDWIKAPRLEDRTTRVHWIQVGGDYADVRIPLARPDLSGAASLSTLPPAALSALAQAEGFAGHVTLSGTQCTWHREVNWHGLPAPMDVGDISFDAQGRMIEAGVHASYTELWVRQPVKGQQVLRFAGDGYLGLLATAGPRAVLGIGRADKPAMKPVVDALAAGDVPAGVAALFDGLHALCHITGDTVIADLATQPFVEGTPVLTIGAETVTWHRVAFDGTRADVVLARATAVA